VKERRRWCLTLKPHTRSWTESRPKRRKEVIETTETLVKTMESILEEREASRMKEKEAVESLNTVLQRMGYQIVPLQQGSKRRTPAATTAPTGRGRSRPRKEGAPSSQNAGGE